MSGIFQTLLPVFYGVLLIGFGSVFFRQTVNRNWLFPTVIATLVLHILYIGAYTVAAGHCLLTNIYELSSLIAFTLLATYAVVELRKSGFSAGTGMMVVLVSCVFQFISSINANPLHLHDTSQIFSNLLFNLHVTTAVFGYSALTLATIYGSLYLLLYRAMRRNAFGPLFHEVPSLDRLESFGIRASAVGFLFLSVSIIFGALLVGKNPQAASFIYYITDSKTIATLLIWLVFGLTLLLHRITKIEGRKLVLFWMSGYALTLLSMTIINSFSSDFHNFL